MQCPAHGVVPVQVPWAEPKARFTRLCERLAIDGLRECRVTGATQMLGLRWDEAWPLMECAVARGPARTVRRVIRPLGVDEQAIAKGHRDLTLVCDIEAGTVAYAGEDRKPESVEAYDNALSTEQRARIEAVAMDRWEPDIQATRAHGPDATEQLVCERFPLMGYLGTAVDPARKREHRERLAQGDKTLTGTKYLWLYGREHLPPARRRECTALRRLARKVGRAWAIQETLRELWHDRAPAVARRFWQRWDCGATHSRLQPIRDAAATLKRHLANILTYFPHRITNAVSEGLHSKIQAITHMACGFRNVAHVKTAISFHCGGLDLYPC